MLKAAGGRRRSGLRRVHVHVVVEGDDAGALAGLRELQRAGQARQVGGQGGAAAKAERGEHRDELPRGHGRLRSGEEELPGEARPSRRRRGRGRCRGPARRRPAGRAPSSGTSRSASCDSASSMKRRAGPSREELAQVRGEAGRLHLEEPARAVRVVEAVRLARAARRSPRPRCRRRARASGRPSRRRRSRRRARPARRGRRGAGSSTCAAPTSLWAKSSAPTATRPSRSRRAQVWPGCRWTPAGTWNQPAVAPAVAAPAAAGLRRGGLAPARPPRRVPASPALDVAPEGDEEEQVADGEDVLEQLRRVDGQEVVCHGVLPQCCLSAKRGSARGGWASGSRSTGRAGRRW